MTASPTVGHTIKEGPSLRARVRQALAEAGAVPAQGRILSRVGQAPTAPFATADVVEGGAMRAHALGAAQPLDAPCVFVDGVQRYVVAGHVGVTPLVRAVVAAAAMERAGDQLRVVARAQDEMLVVPGGRLAPPALGALGRAGLPVVEVDAGPRAHPLMDLVAAGEEVERRREALERRITRAARAERPDAWLLVDGALAAAPGRDGERTVGVIKSHETQFLEGADLETALTLSCGARSSVFRRSDRGAVRTWYLRLWPWADRDLLHGLVRVECAAEGEPGPLADRVSRWLMAERAPIARDARWDRLLYPIHEVEMLLGAQLGAWP